jgi:hypothetical protein
VIEDNKTLHVYYNSNKEPLTEVNENEVLKYIFSFKNGKAPDDSKVTSEHLKYGGHKTYHCTYRVYNASKFYIPK